MPKIHRPRYGSLQVWPRKRAAKLLPSVNWEAIKEPKFKLPLLGFLGYKVGMAQAIVRDNTNFSASKGKQIAIPVSIIECPPMKIFSLRFYKNNNVAKEILNENPDKELGRKMRLPKTTKTKEEIEKIQNELNNYEDLRIIIYTVVKKTTIKKTPDIIEVGLNGSIQEKFEFAKAHLSKEIIVSDILNKGQIVDIRAVTKGRGLVGPVKRFGMGLKGYKSEKGVRRPGSLGAWTPSKVSMSVPLAGQTGFFSRVQYNNKVVDVESIIKKNINPKEGFQNFGNIKTDYIVVKGSVAGPSKRQVIITSPLRVTKNILKQNLEIINLQ